MIITFSGDLLNYKCIDSYVCQFFSWWLNSFYKHYTSFLGFCLFYKNKGMPPKECSLYYNKATKNILFAPERLGWWNNKFFRPQFYSLALPSENISNWINLPKAYFIMSDPTIKLLYKILKRFFHLNFGGSDQLINHF